jgi:threonine/homoserine/homoserine lactone efflux protein
MIGSFSLIQKESGRPLKFYEASAFQFINPKAWSIAVTVASGFFPSEENIFIGVIFVSITAAIINFPVCSLWALFGSGLRKFVNDEKVKKLVEYLLAILLVLTGLFILLK